MSGPDDTRAEPSGSAAGDVVGLDGQPFKHGGPGGPPPQTPTEPGRKEPAFDEAPVKPLGVMGGTCFLLNGLGELVAISGKDLDGGRGVGALFAGGAWNGFTAEEWLATWFPPKSKTRAPGSWQRQEAGAWVLKACAAAGFFDAETPVRRVGVWRQIGENGPVAVAHGGAWLGLVERGPAGPVASMRDAGARLQAPGGDQAALYPAGPSGGFPVAAPDLSAPACGADQVLDLAQRVMTGWGWRRPATDATAWFGWLGCAALGAFPDWRAHLWVSARRGAGKSMLAEMAADLLGPMGSAPLNDVTAAGIRQRANGRARAHLFDEQERGENPGAVEQLIELGRTMSGGGAAVVRGGSDHAAATFSLHGAIYFTSIIPGHLEPQDRSRFILLELDRLPESDDPAKATAEYEQTRALAATVGRTLWRRMLLRSVDWDQAFRMASQFVQRLGGEARDGATIGAVLAGWHLLTSDHPMDADALSELEDDARRLLADVQAASEDGEGERCWATIMQTSVHCGAGDIRSIGQILAGAIDGSHSEDDGSRLSRALSRYGLRVMPDHAEPRRTRVYMISGRNATLDREVFRDQRWRAGGHRNALMMLDGVKPMPHPQRVGTAKVRVLQIPSKYWPSLKDDAPSNAEGDL